MTLVCIHSFATAGLVGLRSFLTVWPDQLLPVPSVLLNAPGNHPACQRLATPFAEHLESVLAICEAPVDLFVGYLADAEQVAIVEHALDRHGACLGRLIVDPVCGDHGRAYVTASLVEAWPRLLARADLALPNRTEVALLTGAPEPEAIRAWQTRFPRLTTVVTGIEGPSATVRTELHRPGRAVFGTSQPCRPGYFRGTGDALAAHLLRAHLCRHSPLEESLRGAATRVLHAIDHARAQGATDLVLRPED